VTKDSGEADLGAMRQSYARRTLSEDDLAPDWLGQFSRWFADAVDARPPEPNAMIVTSVGAEQRPSARTVLLKAYDERGLVFFTNYESRKGRELAANPYACLVFPWYFMQRQVIVTGRVERVDREQTEAYFATRPRESQLGAWASPQSQPVADRAELDRLYERTEARFAVVDPIPAPEHWGGLRVRPDSVEFWQGRVGRLHDRLRYVKHAGDGWTVERLAP
jgi:pyridoxamine 5'-phosphate oxidase